MNAERPCLFVAREPDETLRTYLPVLAELRRRGRLCLVLFHHEPTPWAIKRLAELGTPWRKVSLPPRQPPPGPWPALGLGPPLAELRQLRKARALARALAAEIEPAVVVVIQDTLLLERFLVREANRRGRGSLVVQWAFTYPQTMYDRLYELQHGPRPGSPASGGLKPALWRLARRLLDVHFDLVNSYGGGEALVFAVLGPAFREQFLAQGVRKARIEVTGHPLHDLAFAQRAGLGPDASAAVRARYDLPPAARLVLYATQPVLWREVITRDQLRENVRALGRAVAELGPEFLLVLKLHPRESLDQYAGAADGLPIRLIEQAEIAELIAAAEVFVSSSSSTILQAMMLDKPIVTVNFNRVPHFDFYEQIGGTLHVRTHQAAAEALRLATLDEPTRARLAAARQGVLERYARFDGQATRRLADLVEEMAG